ncbi:MAG TPA: hydroxyisourate hydrolase [Azospirillaceae bacterium]|nr:hydroxyisourate hydrolase [Azospirillaceae bacterium]
MSAGQQGGNEPAANLNAGGGRLTTHVLDTAHGRPAAGLGIALYRLEGDARTRLRYAITNDDGRCDGPLLTGPEFRPGRYELVFEVGAYFRAAGAAAADPAFLEEVPVRFGISAAGQHYHVPLLVSPYGYSTYRGS